MRHCRRMCSIGCPKPRSIPSESAATSSASRSCARWVSTLTVPESTSHLLGVRPDEVCPGGENWCTVNAGAQSERDGAAAAGEALEGSDRTPGHGTMAPVTVSPGAVREERRVVTALFADLVGSTALGERLDPEDLKLVVSDAVARM